MLSISLSKTKQALLGVTGNYCSGKTTLCNQLYGLGFEIIELDALGHLALEYKSQQIQNTFGKNILNKNNQINRLQLRKRVFNNFNLLDQLECITHPVIKELLWKKLSTIKKGRFTVLCSANLIEMNLNHVCEKMVFIEASQELIKQRAKKRDNVYSSLIERCLERQNQLGNKHKHVDWVIKNHRDISYLKSQLTEMLISFGWQG